MAEEINEGIYTAQIAEPIGGGYETLLIVQPPIDIKDGLWKRAIASAMSDETEPEQQDHVKSHGDEMIDHLASTEEGSLFAVQTSPLRESYNPDNHNHFTAAVLQQATILTLRAAMITRDGLNSKAVEKVNDAITLF